MISPVNAMANSETTQLRSSATGSLVRSIGECMDQERNNEGKITIALGLE